MTTRTTLLKWCLFAVLCVVGFVETTPARAQPAAGKRPPNVVLILADDFGYECVGANGGTSYRTPNLDKLAASGMRFTRCYVQPLCTPTRAQLLTGVYNVRNYKQFGHLDPQAITFAHLFRRAGYTTGMVGKWQLGQGFDLPKRFGFDEYCLWQLNRRPPRYANPGLEINGKAVDYKNGEYGPDLINNYALDFLKRHKDRPFFLYYAMMLTHAPFQPTPDSPNWNPKAMGEKVNNNVKHFADMTAYMDKLVGKVVARLDELGLRQNTLVLFLGDNGTGKQVTSRMGERVVRGGKGSTTSTGMHVPLIANWPGVVRAGKVNGDLIDSTDILPTLCAAAGVLPPADLKLDGRSFWPQLRGDKGTPRQWFYCWYSRNGGATAEKEFAASDRYKLYRTGALYDYLADPDEERPLPKAGLNAPAATAQRMLQAVLDDFRNARPPHLQKGAKAGK
ncbi:MAG TPA: sulfatase-like hydrolase/transferase [Gemmataceae bacterium]|nr:sulfatase-like hydrolase/transferase [Gemmataceae bacterium]